MTAIADGWVMTTRCLRRVLRSPEQIVIYFTLPIMFVLLRAARGPPLPAPRPMNFFQRGQGGTARRRTTQPAPQAEARLKKVH